MKRHHLAGIIAVTSLLASCKKNLSEQPPTEPVEISAAAKSPSPSSKPNELIVKFKRGTSAEARNKAFGQAGATLKEHILTKTMERLGDNEGVYVLHTSQDSKAAAGQLKKLGEVEYAEPNYYYNHDAISNDSYFLKGQLYGLSGQWSCNADKAWANNHTGSKNVYVAVIDQGAMFNHEDLSANFWTNPYDPVNGIDDDGNGYIDDVHGWDFAGQDNSVFDSPSYDAHGTHVSGTIGAVGGNGIGVAGVNWNVNIISAKFLGPNGGTTEDAIKAIDYVTDLKVRHGLNIVATNNSWGGGDSSLALKEAIQRAGDANILFVAAAGNDAVNMDAQPHYPAALSNDNIISVAAIDNNGAMASFSNYGAKSVDLAAAGWWVYSTVPGEQVKGSGKKVTVTSTYNTMSGTSMACPHVTGAVALYASTHPGATAAQIKAAILGSVIPTPSLQGKTVTGGRLDVSKF